MTAGARVDAPLDDRAIARWRLRSQRLVEPAQPSPEAVVAGLLAVQAENHAQASWAVACRTAGVDADAFARSFDEGAILRTHVLRPTWHFVLPDDIRWLVELTAPRILRTLRQLERGLDLDRGDIEAAIDVVAGALEGGVQLSRAAISERLREAGRPAEGQRLGVILVHAELGARICSGALDGGEHTYALLSERAPRARTLERDEALGEIAQRYLAGHGPATDRDLAYWATLTLTDVRRGIASAADRLRSFEHADRTYWYVEDPPPPGETLSPRAHLLQILDELYRGYQDTRGHLDADGLLPRGREANVGMALVDGQMIGGMRRTVGTDDVRFDVDAFRPLGTEALEALVAAADRYGRFLGLPADLRVRTATRGG